MIKFEIFGIKIEISFLLICFLNLILIVYGEFVLFWCGISAIFHELCHILSLFYFGCKPDMLKFQISGIVLKKKTELSNFANVVVLSAGCFGNFVLFLFFYFIKFKFAMIVNLCLFMFNMLPHEKLDGGQLLEMALQKLKKNDIMAVAKILNITSKLGFVLLLVLSLGLILKFRNYNLLFFTLMLNFLT